MRKRRGDEYAGGRYVGTTTAGVEWVARETRVWSLDDAFSVLCERFDAREKRRVSRLPATVIDEAEDLLDIVRESEWIAQWHEWVEIRRTVITAPLTFYRCLAQRLREVADDYRSGDRTTEAFRGDREQLVLARDERLADTLERYARRFEQML